MNNKHNSFDINYKIAEEISTTLSQKYPINILNIKIYDILTYHLFIRLLDVYTEESKSRFKFVKFLKRSGFDFIINFWFTFIFSKINLRTVPDISKTLLLYEVNNTSINDSLNEVSNSINSICLISSFRFLKNINNKNVIILYNFLKWSEVNPPLEGLSDAINATLKHYSSYIRNYIGLNKYIFNIIKQIIRDIYSISNMLSAISPNKIIMGSDAFKIGHILSELGPKYDYKTLVLMHGHPFIQYGYTPVHADAIAVWGEDSRNFFLDHGVPATKIIIAGNIRFNKYKLFSDYKILKNNNRIIFFSNTENKKTILRYINFLSKNKSNFDFVLKIHPSESSSEYVSYFNSNNINNVEIYRDESLSDIVGYNDIVVTSSSTVCLDLIFLGASLIYFSIGEFDYSLRLKNQIFCQFISNEEDLINAIINATDKIYPDIYKEEYLKYLQYYLGPLNGAITSKLITEIYL